MIKGGFEEQDRKDNQDVSHSFSILSHSAILKNEERKAEEKKVEEKKAVSWFDWFCGTCTGNSDQKAERQMAIDTGRAPQQMPSIDKSQNRRSPNDISLEIGGDQLHDSRQKKLDRAIFDIDGEVIKNDLRDKKRKAGKEQVLETSGQVESPKILFADNWYSEPANQRGQQIPEAISDDECTSNINIMLDVDEKSSASQGGLLYDDCPEPSRGIKHYTSQPCATSAAKQQPSFQDPPEEVAEPAAEGRRNFEMNEDSSISSGGSIPEEQEPEIVQQQQLVPNQWTAGKPQDFSAVAAETMAWRDEEEHQLDEKNFQNHTVNENFERNFFAQFQQRTVSSTAHRPQGLDSSVAAEGNHLPNYSLKEQTPNQDSQGDSSIAQFAKLEQRLVQVETFGKNTNHRAAHVSGIDSSSQSQSFGIQEAILDKQDQYGTKKQLLGMKDDELAEFERFEAEILLDEKFKQTNIHDPNISEKTTPVDPGKGPNATRNMKRHSNLEEVNTEELLHEQIGVMERPEAAPYELNFELQNLKDRSNSRLELVFSECGNSESKLGNLQESIAPPNQTPRHQPNYQTSNSPLNANSNINSDNQAQGQTHQQMFGTEPKSIDLIRLKYQQTAAAQFQDNPNGSYLDHNGNEKKQTMLDLKQLDLVVNTNKPKQCKKKVNVPIIHDQQLRYAMSPIELPKEEQAPAPQTHRPSASDSKLALCIQTGQQSGTQHARQASASFLTQRAHKKEKKTSQISATASKNQSKRQLGGSNGIVETNSARKIKQASTGRAHAGKQNLESRRTTAQESLFKSVISCSSDNKTTTINRTLQKKSHSTLKSQVMTKVKQDTILAKQPSASFLGRAARRDCKSKKSMNEVFAKFANADVDKTLPQVSITQPSQDGSILQEAMRELAKSMRSDSQTRLASTLREQSVSRKSHIHDPSSILIQEPSSILSDTQGNSILLHRDSSQHTLSGSAQMRKQQSSRELVPEQDIIHEQPGTNCTDIYSDTESQSKVSPFNNKGTAEMVSQSQITSPDKPSHSRIHKTDETTGNLHEKQYEEAVNTQAITIEELQRSLNQRGLQRRNSGTPKSLNSENQQNYQVATLDNQPTIAQQFAYDVMGKNEIPTFKTRRSQEMKKRCDDQLASLCKDHQESYNNHGQYQTKRPKNNLNSFHEINTNCNSSQKKVSSGTTSLMTAQFGRQHSLSLNMSQQFVMPLSGNQEQMPCQVLDDTGDSNEEPVQRRLVFGSQPSDQINLQSTSGTPKKVTYVQRKTPQKTLVRGGQPSLPRTQTTNQAGGGPQFSKVVKSNQYDSESNFQQSKTPRSRLPGPAPVPAPVPVQRILRVSRSNSVLLRQRKDLGGAGSPQKASGMKSHRNTADKEFFASPRGLGKSHMGAKQSQSTAKKLSRQRTPLLTTRQNPTTHLDVIATRLNQTKVVTTQNRQRLKPMVQSTVALKEINLTARQPERRSIKKLGANSKAEGSILPVNMTYRKQNKPLEETKAEGVRPRIDSGLRNTQTRTKNMSSAQNLHRTAILRTTITVSSGRNNKSTTPVPSGSPEQGASISHVSSEKIIRSPGGGAGRIQKTTSSSTLKKASFLGKRTNAAGNNI